jgi:hypothetical protein
MKKVVLSILAVLAAHPVVAWEESPAPPVVRSTS